MARLSRADRDALRRALESARRGTSSAARALYLRLRGRPAAEVLAILDEAGAEYAKALEAELREQIVAAQRIGTRAAARRLFQMAPTRNLPSDLANKAAEWLERRVREASSLRVSPLTGARTAMVDPEGTVWLSRALHGGNLRRLGVIDGLRRAVTEAVRQGETATSLAQRLRDDIGHRVAIVEGGPAIASIPPQVAEMERAALRAIRAGGPGATEELARARREFAKYKAGLRGGKYGTRSAARSALADLESAIRRGSAEAVDRAVKWYAWNREQEHQRLIARTETARAYNRAYVAGSRAVPWVSGWQWVAEGESCEECTALDGTFIPRDAPGPFPPLHPNCDCWLEEVLDPDVEPTEAEWRQMLAA